MDANLERITWADLPDRPNDGARRVLLHDGVAPGQHRRRTDGSQRLRQASHGGAPQGKAGFYGA